MRKLSINLITLSLLLVLLLAGLCSASWSPVRAQSDFDCSAVTEIPQTECEALVTLYNTTGGEDWQWNTDWLETNTPCGWSGVTCTDDGVIELHLSGGPDYGELTYNNLSGSIPPEIDNLTALEVLDLSFNFLNGSIPPEVGNLTALRSLELSFNDLSGPIPSEIGKLDGLENLSLDGNDLTDLPPEIGNLSSLRYLSLFSNELVTVPPEIGNLSNLGYLNLDSTQLTGVPPEIGNLSLDRLSLSNNQLTSIPPEIGDIIALHELDLSHNQLTGIPSQIGDSSFLFVLVLEDNPLSGELPDFLTSLPLDLFDFHDTGWCVPPTGPVPEWLNGITQTKGTGLVCGGFSVSGRVTDASGDGIQEVKVSAGTTASAVTDAHGNYSISGFITGTYTVTPTKSGCAFTPETSTLSVPPDATGQDFIGHKHWTLMYYLATDNNLNGETGHIFQSLRAASANASANIVALSDKRLSYTRYHVIRPDGLTPEAKGELSTGDPNTLKDFVQWAQEEYPAEHYALIIYDHGHGHTGVAYDHDAPGDDKDCGSVSCLALNEWRDALSETDRIDVIYMTACLMGNIESGYQLRGLADYYVASEAIMWTPEFDWYVTGQTGTVEDTTITVPPLDSQTTPIELAIAMAQSYRLAMGTDHPGTISVANLNAVESLEEKTSALAGLLKAQMKQVHSMITQIKLDVQRFDSDDKDMEIGWDDEVVDLYHFAEQVELRTTDSDIRAAAADLMGSIQEYVVGEDRYELAWSGVVTDDDGVDQYWNHSNSHGVSIFFTDYSRSFYKDGWFDFAAGTVWDIESSAVGESGVDESSGTLEWGSMLVEYVRETNPDTPDNPDPPALVAPLRRLTSVYLPMVLRSVQ